MDSSGLHPQNDEEKGIIHQTQKSIEFPSIFWYHQNEMEEKDIILNNLLVHYYAWKNPRTESRAILFLHGWRSDGSVWLPLIPALLEKTECGVYALDLPGFGKSQTPPQSFSLADYAEIIKTFIEKLGLTEATLIGHSFGGRVAIKLAADYRGLASIVKIVLVDSAGVTLKDMRLEAKKFIAKITKPFFRLPFLSRLREPLYRAIGSDDYLATPELQSVFVRVINEDLVPLLSGIRQKTLIVWGENDTVTPLEAGKMMAEKIPGAQLTVLENAGHFSFLGQKEEFVKTIAEFLKN